MTTFSDSVPDLDVLRALNPDLDQKNLLILEIRAVALARRDSPQVGEFVKMLDGTLRRFTHAWPDGIQTNVPKFSDGDRFYLSDDYAEFSGCLDKAIPEEKLRGTSEMHTGIFWFFRDNYVKAHNGVTVRCPCRVWQMLP